MPYNAISELPPAVKKLPKGAQEIYKSAFNAAFVTYKGEEHKAHATAWTAVERKYHKVNEQWVARESSDISADDKRNLLQTALNNEYMLTKESPIPDNATIEDVFETQIIYSVNGQLYRANYTLDEDRKVTISDEEKVEMQTTYNALESLRPVYAEIIQEVGKRNASFDSGRIRKILELCQELLSSEEEDEKKIVKVTKEAKDTLEWVKTFEVMKMEDETKYPAEAFAYMPDSNKPSTWKLRMWEDGEKKVTKAQLGRIAASLSPGGYKGQKVSIPEADLAVVKRKLRLEYRKLGIDEDDISKWVKETETRELLRTYIPLTEATFDKGRARVIIIKPGFNATSDRYYPAEVLKRDFSIFEGQKMYADHPTEQEDKDRPERSIKDWVATLTEVECDESGVVTGVAEIVEPWLMQKLASLRDKEMLSEMGISINAVGNASKGTIEGKETLVIEKLVAARSVDFVTEPGAGGEVTFYEAERHDIDLVDLASLRDRRPDLVKIIEATIRTEILTEVKIKMDNEERIKELESQVTDLTKERDDLQTHIAETAKEKAKADVQASIKGAIEKADLPDAAKEQMLHRWENLESAEGIEEAIRSEIDYIAKLSEAGKVKNLGVTVPDPEKATKALKESWKEMHPEWTDDQIETAINGR